MTGTTFPPIQNTGEYQQNYQGNQNHSNLNDYGGYGRPPAQPEQQQQNNSYSNTPGQYQNSPQAGGSYPNNNRGNYPNKQNNRQGEGGNWKGGSGGWKGQKETDLSFYRPYAVTGNKDAPDHILQKACAIVQRLEQMDFTLRTGGLAGIEDSVEKVTKKHEIHLPFRDFDQKQSRYTFTTDRAKSVAAKFSPGYSALKKGIQLFLAKNVRILMGNNVNSPSLFLIVYSSDGCTHISQKTQETGFATHAIAVASGLGIPIFNLADPNFDQKFENHLRNFVIPTDGESWTG